MSANPKDVENTIVSALGWATSWAKRIASIVLLAFVVIVVFRLIGIDLYPAAKAGYQEMGVFLAGAAFALSKL